MPQKMQNYGPFVADILDFKIRCERKEWDRALLTLDLLRKRIARKCDAKPDSGA